MRSLDGMRWFHRNSLGTKKGRDRDQAAMRSAFAPKGKKPVSAGATDGGADAGEGLSTADKVQVRRVW